MHATPEPYSSVLVVDDEKSIRATLATFLRAAGYIVDVAETAAEAQQLLAERRFDLLLTDIVMPGLTGLDLLRYVHDQAPETLVLIMTGEPSVETAIEAVRAGAHDFLTKPFSKQEVLHHVGQAARVSCLLREKRLLEEDNQLYQSQLEQLVEERTRSLRQTEMRLLAALEAARAIAWEFDTEHRLLKETGPVADVFGLLDSPRHTSPEHLLASILPDDRPLFRDAVRHAASDGGRLKIAIRVLADDGGVRWIDVDGRVIADELGRPRRLSGIARDVTEARLLRASLAQADRLASMGMLAAGVAHEINNPLSYVLYHLESLARELPETDCTARDASPTGWRERASEALHGATRIQEISRSLGAFSRVEQVEPEQVDLHVAIEHACRMAQNELKYRARLSTALAADLPPVLATEGKLAQVFLNLLVNAAHAMDESQALVNEVEIRTWAEGDQVCASVRDTGCGIPRESLGRVFEPFFTTKPVGVGSGLGLPLCRGIVESFGGTIAVVSQPGVGTIFELRLPRLELGAAGPAHHASPEAAPETAGQPARILAIDDDDAIRRMLAQMLGREHEVVEAASVAEAKARIEADPAFDLILCDVMMPSVSGIELHRWLVEHAPALAAGVVFITGGAFTTGTREYLESIPNPQLAKPFRAGVLRELVQHCLAERPMFEVAR